MKGEHSERNTAKSSSSFLLNRDARTQPTTHDDKMGSIAGSSSWGRRTESSGFSNQCYHRVSYEPKMVKNGPNTRRQFYGCALWPIVIISNGLMKKILLAKKTREMIRICCWSNF
ncbi:unnamed protein product [Cuscuta europaea]|uniref:Uncharacterized protein n=1 Tax=Cuscuta europaea TaxID=41803 RepID=A0A9P0ZU86_CUSEU|nr:unnamed protein product [Cuscuta europaea]